MMRHAYHLVWVPRNYRKEPNPVWTSLLDGSFVPDDGARVVSAQFLSSPQGDTFKVLVPGAAPTDPKWWMHSEGILLTLEYLRDVPYRETP